MAARRAGDGPIAVDYVRGAAHDWYLRSKEKAISANPEAQALLHWIIDKVIGERRAPIPARAGGKRVAHPLVNAVYDARVPHVIKGPGLGISAVGSDGQRAVTG